MNTRTRFAALAPLLLLASCATYREPVFPASHPASTEAPEAVTPPARRTLTVDELTSDTQRRLAEKEKGGADEMHQH